MSGARRLERPSLVFEAESETETETETETGAGARRHVRHVRRRIESEPESEPESESGPDPESDSGSDSGSASEPPEFCAECDGAICGGCLYSGVCRCSSGSPEAGVRSEVVASGLCLLCTRSVSPESSELPGSAG